MRISFRGKIQFIIGSIILLYLILLVPDRESEPMPGPGKNPFVWNQDERWHALEKSFLDIKRLGCAAVTSRLDSALSWGESLLSTVMARPVKEGSPVLDSVEYNLFELAAMKGACPAGLDRYIRLLNGLRAAVKIQSRRWDMKASLVRDRLYRLLYGSRAALEEVLLQAKRDSVPAVIRATDEPSATPVADILGVPVHSGDILVSRGGAPTSALIARGSDYPGNFSHVALVHVDAQSHVPSIVEAHIERGVTVSPVEEYLRDTKLRVMVLRLRSDLAEMVKDPLLPHRAASAALSRARAGHIPYDFEMDADDDSKIFCSEVASGAYRGFGITLWMGLSAISSPGLRAWLSAFGVTHFETQEPSDLEYDPQLTVVAEWRNVDALRKDHIDNAAVEVLLEGAEKGERLEYDWYLLPVARCMKAYSSVLNLFGHVGPVPEGMSAVAALRNKRLTARHAALADRIVASEKEFFIRKNYHAPYWRLLEMARRAKDELEEE